MFVEFSKNLKIFSKLFNKLISISTTPFFSSLEPIHRTPKRWKLQKIPFYVFRMWNLQRSIISYYGTSFYSGEIELRICQHSFQNRLVVFLLHSSQPITMENFMPWKINVSNGTEWKYSNAKCYVREIIFDFWRFSNLKCNLMLCDCNFLRNVCANEFADGCSFGFYVELRFLMLRNGKV